MAKSEIEKLLRMALALEKKNYSDYKRSAADAELESIRKMFEFLAGEEEKHIILIQEKMEHFGIEEGEN